MASMAQRYPSGFGRLLCALDFSLGAPKEIALIGLPDAPDTLTLKKEIWGPYLPNKVVAQAAPADARASELIPLLSGRTHVEGRATAYVCEHFTCKNPTTDRLELASQLKSERASTGSP